MEQSPSAHELLKGAVDFSIAITLSGYESRAGYNVLLVSAASPSLPTQTALPERTDISAAEFERVLNVFAARGVTLHAGTYISDEPEYYVEIRTADGVFYGSLGFDQNTVATLNQLASALLEENRELLGKLIAQLLDQLKK